MAELDSLYGAYELQGDVITTKDSIISVQVIKINNYQEIVKLKDQQIELLNQKGKGRGFWWALMGFALGSLLVK